jgi:hypothetical protein
VIPGIGEEYLEGQGHIGDEYIQYRKGHIRDRRELEGREHIKYDTEVEKERSMTDIREIPKGREKGPETQLDSMQDILNDLARGQRDMMNSIAKIAIST